MSDTDCNEDLLFEEPDALIENYASWRLVEANVTYGSGIPRPISEVSDDEFLID